GATDLADRAEFARRAFQVSSHYDTAIYQYFNRDAKAPTFKQSIQESRVLRYGENPHQAGYFHGPLEDLLVQLNGKALSYNNLVDIDAAIGILAEFHTGDPAFAVLKHTNPCGVAVRPTLLEAWKDALAGDPVSAFGGILICNRPVDLATAKEINELFYEVLIAPAFEEDALALLSAKKKRILLELKSWDIPNRSFRRLLNGVIEQETDLKMETVEDFQQATEKAPSAAEMEDLVFANKCAKHLKSNTIALVKGQQLIGMGCGQTSRVDALKQAIIKAKAFGFELEGAVMASDAFFPFPDCVEIAHQAGITAVVQPGGSIRDKDSIDYCNANGLAMVLTGTRHFRH
ncbi:MAG: bifunctional phosphoribosylaminoimidazolecarboxamide formyltransferase/IMP cyclohydrolase, partial [Bacteroidota bacterium]